MYSVSNHWHSGYNIHTKNEEALLSVELCQGQTLSKYREDIYLFESAFEFCHTNVVNGLHELHLG